MASLLDWIINMIPDESSRPEKVRNAHKKVALLGIITAAAVFLLLAPVTFGALFTGLPVFGKVARESDVQITDAHIQEIVRGTMDTELRAVKTKVDNVFEQLNTMQQLQTEVFSSAWASEICRDNSRLHKEMDQDERFRLLQNINEKKRKYKQYTGFDFDTRDC